MPTSSPFAGRFFALAVLLAANACLIAVWPWLHNATLGADASEEFFMNLDGETVPGVSPIFRNEDYFRRFAELIKAKQGIFMAGTSETVKLNNLGMQLNVVAPDDPPYFVLARGGMSPIHSCLFVAKCAQDKVDLPPTVLIVNPVYFMASHDVVNEGWMGTAVRTPVFLMMNHNRIQSHLSSDVLNIYKQHFGSRMAAWPFWAQEYLTSLVYLKTHQELPNVDDLPIVRYEFDGVAPEYDKERNVDVGYHASDEMARSRWLVNRPEDSVNIKGLESSLDNLKSQDAPIAVIILPINRPYYAYYDLDMDVFDGNFRDIRDRIKQISGQAGAHVVDLYEDWSTKPGFCDRMHMDSYGFWQMANYLKTHQPYQDFIRSVHLYYENQPKTTAN